MRAEKEAAEQLAAVTEVRAVRTESSMEKLLLEFRELKHQVQGAHCPAELPLAAPPEMSDVSPHLPTSAEQSKAPPPSVLGDDANERELDGTANQVTSLAFALGLDE